MKTKTNDWVDTDTMEVSYGIDVYYNGEWHHAAVEGIPLLFDTKEERDIQRKVIRRLK